MAGGNIKPGAGDMDFGQNKAQVHIPGQSLMFSPDPNNTQTEYQYDSLYRLTRLENKGSSGIISSYKYTLGPAGNRVKIEEANGDVNEYQYDKLYRLTKEQRSGQHAYQISYQYDAFGNRLQQNANGQVTSYQYDKNDRLLTETGPSGAVTYQYDNNGNTTAKSAPGENWAYQWNAENKLIAAKKNDQLAASYEYDFNGERIKTVTPAETTNYLVDLNNRTGYSQVIRETNAQGSEAVAYTFGDDLISQIRGGSASFYHYDGLGSTRALTNSQAAVTDTYNYVAFGEILSKTGTTVNNYLFTGEQYDPNIAYYYLRARLYNPENGRFLSLDPFSGTKNDPRSLHKYLYASNDPISIYDPSGLFGMEDQEYVMAIADNVMEIMLNAARSIAWMAFRLFGAGIGGWFGGNALDSAIFGRPDADCPTGIWGAFAYRVSGRYAVGGVSGGLQKAYCLDGLFGGKGTACDIAVSCVGVALGQKLISASVHAGLTFATHLYDKGSWDNRDSSNISIGMHSFQISASRTGASLYLVAPPGIRFSGNIECVTQCLQCGKANYPLPVVSIINYIRKWFKDPGRIATDIQTMEDLRLGPFYDYDLEEGSVY